MWLKDIFDPEVKTKKLKQEELIGKKALEEFLLNEGFSLKDIFVAKFLGDNEIFTDYEGYVSIKLALNDNKKLTSVKVYQKRNAYVDKFLFSEKYKCEQVLIFSHFEKVMVSNIARLIEVKNIWVKE